MLQRLQKYQTFFLAMMMFFLLAPWFAPAQNTPAFFQLDFWVLWLISMFLLALPLLFLEVALAKRSKKMPMIGMEELTRQADANTYWRSVSWLALSLITLVCGGMLANNATSSFNHIATLNPDSMTNGYLWLVLSILAVCAISFIGKKILPLAFLAALVAVITSGINISSQWTITSVTSTEWKNAVLLAITATGLGTGLYWQSALSKQKQQETLLLVLPVWVAQVVAGLVFILFQGISSQISYIFYAIASIFAAAFLLALVRENVQAHKNSTIKAVVLPIILLLISAFAWQLITSDLQYKNVMLNLVAGLSLLTTGIYAVFAGWHMKISHLRKSINFSSETTYNIWRVAIRIAVPLAIASALVVWMVSFLT